MRWWVNKWWNQEIISILLGNVKFGIKYYRTYIQKIKFTFLNIIISTGCPNQDIFMAQSLCRSNAKSEMVLL